MKTKILALALFCGLLVGCGGSVKYAYIRPTSQGYIVTVRSYDLLGLDVDLSKPMSEPEAKILADKINVDMQRSWSAQ